MAKDVEHRTFIGIMARGSSRKEVLDKNEKQFVYFLHQGFLYNWVSLNENSKYDKLMPVCQTSSSAFHTINDGLFVLMQED